MPPVLRIQRVGLRLTLVARQIGPAQAEIGGTLAWVGRMRIQPRGQHLAAGDRIGIVRLQEIGEAQARQARCQHVGPCGCEAEDHRLKAASALQLAHHRKHHAHMAAAIADEQDLHHATACCAHSASAASARSSRVLLALPSRWRCSRACTASGRKSRSQQCAALQQPGKPRVAFAAEPFAHRHGEHLLLAVRQVVTDQRRRCLLVPVLLVLRRAAWSSRASGTRIPSSSSRGRACGPRSIPPFPCGRA